MIRQAIGYRIPAFVLGMLAAHAFAASATEESPLSLRQRHIDARGGRSALEELKVIERYGSFTHHGSIPPATGTYHTCLRYPDRVVIDIDAGPVQVHQVLSAAGALECDANFEKCIRANESVADELRKTAQTANREELDESIPEDAMVQPILAGTVPVGYRYEKEKRIVEKEYSPESHLLRRAKNGQRERHYGAAWQDAGGVLIPMQIEDFQDDKKLYTIALNTALNSRLPSAWCTRRISAQAVDTKLPLPGPPATSRR